MTHILGKGASGLRRRMRLGEIQTALAEIYFSILLSASAHSPRARPGFRPGKGSGQLRQLKTPSWRNQNQRRQPILFPLGKARTGCCCLSPAPAVLGTSRPRPKGHAESFPGMLRDIPRRDIQKAPGTMPDTYRNKLGLLRDKKCDQGGWGVGGGSLVQENHAGIAQTREQVLPLQQEFLILLVSRVLCSERCKGLNWNAS